MPWQPRIAYDIVAGVDASASSGALLTRPAGASATDVIRNAIVEGRLGPGERLKEERLASELGISRTPIREALLVLQSEGLVDSVPNRGAFVRSYELDALRDLYELRAVLEGHAARRAALRLTPDELDELRASCARFGRLVDGPGLPDPDGVRAIVRENNLFHTTIHAAAAHERLATMVRQVIALPLVYRSYVWYSESQRQASAHAHVQLVRAFEQHDADRAEIVMREHVYAARDVLAERIDDTPELLRSDS